MMPDIDWFARLAARHIQAKAQPTPGPFLGAYVYVRVGPEVHMRRIVEERRKLIGAYSQLREERTFYVYDFSEASLLVPLPAGAVVIPHDASIAEIQSLRERLVQEARADRRG